jgi:hypothetical protein
MLQTSILPRFKPGHGFALVLLTLCSGMAAFSGYTLMANEDAMVEQIRKPDRPNAPEFDGAVAWINTDKPLKLADLKGKIVLLDFWTFG